jgi:O-acetyl-ADP-ribose deacetylase
MCFQKLRRFFGNLVLQYSLNILLSICLEKDILLGREIDAMKLNIGKRVIELLDGDITEMDTDAIVNAANAQSILGGGVAGAIRQKGGPMIQQECNKIGGTFVGGAVITTGGKLKAKYVIHAVGPRMGEGDEDNKLKNAMLNSLKLADKHNLKSIAFPAISSGIFGFPIDRCAEIMLQTSIEYLKGQTNLQRVVFCLYGKESYEVFENQLKQELAK